MNKSESAASVGCETASAEAWVDVAITDSLAFGE